MSQLSLIHALDGEQLMEDLEALAKIGDPGPGVNRIAYTPADKDGRKWIEAQMRALGMQVRTDALGSVIGLYPGAQPELAPIAMGSHTDTVPHGGKYDGALGVIAALACVRTLRDTNTQTRHPIEIIDFAAEEASMPGATFGSRGMVGKLPSNVLQQTAWDGETVESHLRAAGLDPAAISQAIRPRGALAAYLELHIEQGGILEKARLPMGIVKGIVGIRRYQLTFHGYANHAGTTPMDGRRDALVAAAPFIMAVRDVAVKRGIVGTVGTLQVFPNSANVIPARVELSVEIRALDETVLDDAEAELRGLAAQAGADVADVVRKPPVLSDPRVMNAFASVSQELGLPCREMASGAGHDAMCMADIAPEAMLFVPSVGGVSHSPDEYTRPEDCVNGARVLLGALLKLDAELD